MFEIDYIELKIEVCFRECFMMMSIITNAESCSLKFGCDAFLIPIFIVIAHNGICFLEGLIYSNYTFELVELTDISKT